MKHHTHYMVMPNGTMLGSIAVKNANDANIMSRKLVMAGNSNVRILTPGGEEMSAAEAKFKLGGIS